MQREACLPKQPWVSISTYTSFLYLSFQYYRLHSTLFRDIDESLLYSTDSDEEDPFFLMSPSAAKAKECGSGGQRLLADSLLSLAAVGGGSRGRCIDQGHKTPFFSPPKKHRTAEEINSTFLGCTVTQVSGHMLKGSPSTQQAALSVLADLAMPDNNVSKIIVSSKAVNGTPTQGMSQDTCKLLLHSKKITKSG